MLILLSIFVGWMQQFSWKVIKSHICTVQPIIFDYITVRISIPLCTFTTPKDLFPKVCMFNLTGHKIENDNKGMCSKLYFQREKYSIW